MQPKRPTHLLLDQVRKTRDGDTATIDHADANAPRVHMTIGLGFGSMTDADIVSMYNGFVDAQSALLQQSDKTVVEEPPGEPQIDYHENSYQYGGTPILPESLWPPVLCATLPATAYPEKTWRRWTYATTVAGPIVTLPFLLRWQLLRLQILVPETCVGAAWAGRPEVIMSGLDSPGQRFLPLSDRGLPSGFWLVREINHG